MIEIQMGKAISPWRQPPLRPESPDGCDEDGHRGSVECGDVCICRRCYEYISPFA